MKKIIFLLLICFIQQARAQKKETFDVLTYLPPAGFKKEIKEGSTAYTLTNNKGGYVMLVLFKSINGTGSLSTDFQNDWQTLVARPYQVSGDPEPKEGEAVSDWKNLTGGANFQFNGSNSAALLSTFVSGKRVFSYIILLNDQDLLNKLNPFLGSLSLADPATVSNTTTTVPGNKDSGLTGTWYTYSMISNSVTHSYIKKQYTFHTDGTYEFYKKTFDISWSFILLTREKGTYTVSGNVLTVNPASCVTEKWNKKNRADQWGNLLTTEKKPLEKVSYQVSKTYFGSNLTLILSTPKPTTRDGVYATNNDYPRSYFYEIPPSQDYLIQLPGK